MTLRDKKMTKSEKVFDPHWPPALKQNTQYKVSCDDKGRNGRSWLKVIVANDGDVHVSMHETRTIAI